MSYCRTGIDSDVYVFGSGSALEAYVAVQVAADYEIPSAWQVEYDDKDSTLALKAMLGHLHFLRFTGLKVPDRAIHRLLREIERGNG